MTRKTIKTAISIPPLSPVEVQSLRDFVVLFALGDGHLTAWEGNFLNDLKLSLSQPPVWLSAKQQAIVLQIKDKLNYDRPEVPLSPIDPDGMEDDDDPDGWPVTRNVVDHFQDDELLDAWPDPAATDRHYPASTAIAACEDRYHKIGHDSEHSDLDKEGSAAMSSDPDVYPFDTIAYITDTINGQSWQGSGVLISPDEVLTASHVIYNSTGGPASNITVSLGYNAGNATLGTTTVQSMHYNAVQDAGDTLTNEQSQNDYAVLHLSAPFSGVGTMGLESNFTGGSANVSGYPAAAGGTLQTSQQTVSQQPGLTILDGTSIGPGSSGGPVWVTGSDGLSYVTGVVSTAAGAIGSQGYFTQLSTAAFNQIETWVAQDDAGLGVGAPITIKDNATGQQFAPVAASYTGPVQGLTNQYISVTTDSLNISAASPGWFIHGGAGMNSISVSSGINVLDGGSASSFMTSGTGSDTFYADLRGTAAKFWDTVNNLHAGDAATLWGVSQAGFSLSWTDNQGADGHLGLTLHATSLSGTNVAMTFVGFSQTDVMNGRLGISFGGSAASQSAYMHITVNS